MSAITLRRPMVPALGNLFAMKKSTPQTEALGSAAQALSTNKELSLDDIKSWMLSDLSVIVYDSFNPDSLFALWCAMELRCANGDDPDARHPRLYDVRSKGWKALNHATSIAVLGVTTYDERVQEMTNKGHSLFLDYFGQSAYSKAQHRVTTNILNTEAELPLMDYDALVSYKLALVMDETKVDMPMVFRVLRALGNWRTMGRHSLATNYTKDHEREQWKALIAIERIAEIQNDKVILAYVLQYCTNRLVFKQGITPRLAHLFSGLFSVSEGIPTLLAADTTFVHEEASYDWQVKQVQIDHLIESTQTLVTLNSKPGKTTKLVTALVVNCTQADFLLVTEHARKNYNTILGFSTNYAGKKRWFLWSTDAAAKECFEHSVQAKANKLVATHELNYLVY